MKPCPRRRDLEVPSFKILSNFCPEQELKWLFVILGGGGVRAEEGKLPNFEMKSDPVVLGVLFLFLTISRTTKTFLKYFRALRVV